jgi:hypothetical protein
MNLVMLRETYDKDGIFSQLWLGDEMAVTLEHSYWIGDTWVAKIPLGEFVCVRGQHRLHGMNEDFETFEITGIEGHSNLLFHWGNFNKDSEGCVLLGEKITDIGGSKMVTNSRMVFRKFMQLQAGIDSFSLKVEEMYDATTD